MAPTPTEGLETPQLAIAWTRILDRLRAEVGEVEYQTWIRQVRLVGMDGDEITLSLPTRFLRDWVSTCYGLRLRTMWQAEMPAIRRLDLRTGATNAIPAVVADVRSEPEGVRGHGKRAEFRSDLGVALNPRFTFENFVVGKPNEFAYACARRVAEQPASEGFNPLFLYGGVGLGKTHLMHATAWALADQTNKPFCVVYMSAEKFMDRFLAAIPRQSTAGLGDHLRGVEVLMIDDVQFLIGKDNAQDEFFQTFNFLVEQGKQIVVSADKAPLDFDGLEHRLRARLGCGRVADLQAPTYELRMSILEVKAERGGIEVPVKVLDLLAHKITSNVRELEGALSRLVAHAELFGREVSLKTAQDVLHDVLKAHDRRVTIEEIQKKVAEHFSIRVTDMSSAWRARAVVRPRQVAMYLAKHLTDRSLPDIGRRFGGRDHTTVMHAVTRVTELMERDDGFAEEVELLRSLLA
jgi:chromosomal replication initiator protein